MKFDQESLNKTPSRKIDVKSFSRSSSFEESKSPENLTPMRILMNHEIASNRANQVSEYVDRVNKSALDQISKAQGVLDEYHA